MPIPNSLEVECRDCRVSKTCPRVGSSPAMLGSGTKMVCRIVGGYGRQPVDPAILSPESLERSKSDGPCLTIAEVPSVVDGTFVIDVVKIFAPAVTHEREKVAFNAEMIYPRTHTIR